MENADLLFREIFENSKVGMAVLGKRGQILHCNPHFTEMLGYPEKEIKERALGTYLHHDFREEFNKKFQKIISGEEKYNKSQLKYVKNGGNSAWWLVNLALVFSRDFGKRFISAIIEDITEQIEEREKLKAEKENAEKSTRIKSDFLANMSHEIRTPIHTIMGMNDLLLETKLDEEQQEYAEQVRFSAEVLLSLINDILDFSKIEAGKLHLETIDFDLLSVVEESVDLVSLKAHKKGLEVALYLEPNIPVLLRGDPVRLRQIIVNLFNNAVKFTREGEVVVTVRLHEETDEHVILKFFVRDTGLGIPQDRVDKLFKAFSQVDASTTRKFGGTGLGLSISRNLTKMMNGQIGVESEYGKGSTFWFTVRLKKQDREGGIVAVPEEAAKAKVLVVDDNNTARSVLRKYLEECKCLVSEAENGHQALSMLREAADKGLAYDICFIDLLMPRMDGWQLASEINADKQINSTKLVLLSPAGKSGDEAKMKLLHWFDAYLNKPLKKRELFDCLKKLSLSESELEMVEETAPLKEIEEVEEETFKDQAILIAEDHEVNQQLFKTILESLGCTVRVANNGLEAVQAVEREHFSLIFMDVQMPELNGYEASIKIREMGIRTPIIAATASAVKGERERCLEAGMNDILVKPFKKKDVLPLLKKWIAPQQPSLALTGSNSGMVSQAPSSAEASHYIFDYKEAIETFMGNEEVVRNVLKAFLKKAEEQIPLMHQALSSKDFEKLRGEAHSMKGGAFNLSVNKLGEQSKWLEETARAKNEEESSRALEDLKAAFEEFRSMALKHIETL